MRYNAHFHRLNIDMRKTASALPHEHVLLMSNRFYCDCDSHAGISWLRSTQKVADAELLRYDWLFKNWIHSFPDAIAPRHHDSTTLPYFTSTWMHSTARQIWLRSVTHQRRRQCTPLFSLRSLPLWSLLYCSPDDSAEILVERKICITFGSFNKSLRSSLCPFLLCHHYLMLLKAHG